MWFDSSVVETVVGSVPAWSVVAFLVISYLGSIYVIGPLVVTGSLFDHERITSWPAIIIGAYGLFVTLKPLFGVSRPPVGPPIPVESVPVLLSPVYEQAVGFSTGSFPSGHAIAATVFFGLLVVDLSVSTFRRRLAVAGGIVTLICFSRVALGVHYIGDLVGGVLLGLPFLGIALAVRQRIRSRYVFLALIAAVPALGGLFTGRPEDVGILITATLLTAIGLALDQRSEWFGPTRRRRHSRQYRADD